jgi:hypothetical protein
VLSGNLDSRKSQNGTIVKNMFFAKALSKTKGFELISEKESRNEAKSEHFLTLQFS